MENLNFSPKRSYDFQNLRNQTLFTADQESVMKSAFDCSAAKLWLKEALFCGMFALLNE